MDVEVDGQVNLASDTTPAGGSGDDWWMTLYDLMDRVWSLCTGVCEYAVGKGRVGEISLGLDRDRDYGGEGDRDGEEDARLLDDQDIQDGQEEGDMEMESEVGKGRMIMRQLYHNTHHLHQRLQDLSLDDGGITKGQARRLTGQWIVSEDDIRFWTDLRCRWGISS